MHELFNVYYQELAERYQLQGPFLEVGAAPGVSAILSGAYFADRPDRFAINLRKQAQQSGITFLKCNSNNMKKFFSDGQFKTVLSNAVLEHDKHFWRSLREMKRVLAPGGHLVIGAPGFIPRAETRQAAALAEIPGTFTITFDVHAQPDYWRFSRQAFTDVVCEHLKVLECNTIGDVPRLIAVAQKE